jgi:DNA-binding MarR family transcriptional regulator
MSTDDLTDLPSAESLHGAVALAAISRRLKNLKLPFSLTWERLSTLSVVARHGPISISALSEHESVSCATASRIVAFLRQKALVRCTGSAKDARAVLVASTAKGRGALQKGLDHSLAQVKTTVGDLDPRSLEAMLALIAESRASRDT